MTTLKLPRPYQSSGKAGKLNEVRNPAGGRTREQQPRRRKKNSPLYRLEGRKVTITLSTGGFVQGRIEEVSTFEILMADGMVILKHAIAMVMEDKR